MSDQPAPCTALADELAELLAKYGFLPRERHALDFTGAFLSDARIAEIQARLDDATPGPWGASMVESESEPIRPVFTAAGDLVIEYEPTWEADAELIHNAPTDLADLLAERRLLVDVAEAYETWRGIPAIASRIEDKRTALLAVDAAVRAWRVPVKCGRAVGSRPWWMSEGQYDPCRCILSAGHPGVCVCEHTSREER